MIPITAENFQSLKNRFLGFYDAVIRGVRIDAPENAVIEISTRDSEEKQSEGWVNLKFEFRGIVDYRFDRGEVFSRYQIMFWGLTMLEEQDFIYLDFAPFGGEPSDLNEFRQSKCMVGSKAVQLHVLPYVE